MIIYLIAFSIVVVAVLQYLCRNRGRPPGPIGVPILGYLPWLDPNVPYKTLTKLSEKYGSIYGLNLGSVYTVVLTDPKVIKTVFAKDITTGRAPLYLTHGIMHGWGLICAEGDLWKDQRRFIHNCLRKFGATKTGQSRDKMEGLILSHVNDLIKYIKDQGNGKAIDPLESLRHSVGSIINVVVFGKSWNRDDELWKWLQHLQEEGTKHIGVAGPLNFLPFLRFIPKLRKTMEFLIDGKIKTHKVYQSIINDQKEKMDGGLSTSIENVIQAFLEERKIRDTEDSERFYNDQQFYHLLADIFGAGLDTTLTTLRWYLLYVAHNKEVQITIRKEIQDVLQGRPPTLEDATYLPFLEASICEAQRIRSVVPLGIPHGSMADMVIEGYTIPKKTMIVPLQWAIHMNEEVYPEPEKFDPNRFLDSEGKVCRNEYFIPFQVGKRMCVGDELARMLLFLFSASILQHFRIELETKDVDFTGLCGITLNPSQYKIIFIHDKS